MKFESQLQIVTAAGVPPFTVNQTALVINLNADLLDGQHGSYYAAASSLGNYLPLTGGTLTGTLTGTVGIFTTLRATELTSLLGSNGPITITPDGTGHVHINSTDIRLGPNNTNATLATRGTGDLILRTNEGSAVEGFIRIYDGANGNIEITPNGTGTVVVGKLSGSTASFSGQITSTVATGTAPLVITSNTVVANLNSDFLDGQHGSFYQNAGNLNAGTLQAARLPAFSGGDVTSTAGTVALILANSGVTAGTYRSVTTDAKGRVTAGTNPTTLAGYGITDALDTSGAAQTKSGNLTVNSALTSGGAFYAATTVQYSNRQPIYTIYYGGGQDLAWKKVADITIGTGLYRGVTFKVDVVDNQGNFGWNSNCLTLTYFASCIRSGGVQDAPNNAVVTGPVADYVRVVKTATGVYELQIRQLADWQTYVFTVEATINSGGNTVTYASSTPPNGSTTGTIYTATATAAAGWTSKLANIAVAGVSSFAGQITSTVATGTAPLVIASTTAVTNLNSDLLDGQHGSYFENRDTTAVGFASGTLTLTRAAGNLTVSLDGRYLPLSGGTTSGAVTFGSTVVFGSSGRGRIYADWAADSSTRSFFAGRNSTDTDWNWGAEFGWDGANQRWYFDTVPFIGGNAALHAGNFNSYALPLTGGALTGTISIDTSGSTALVSSVIIKRSGQSSVNFGQYSGAWRSALQIQSNSSDRLLFLAPPEADYQFGILRSANGGLKIDVGGTTANQGTNAVTIDTAGTANFPVGLQQGGNAVLTAATTSAPNLSIGGSAARWATGRTISLTGDVTGTSSAFDGTAALSFAATLANSGVTAGTYRSVTVNAKGLVTAGTNPTTLSGYGITDAMYQVDPNGFTQGDINGSGNMQRLWGTDSVQNLIAFRPPTTVEYTTDNVNWVATTISNDVFDGKVFGKWAGFNMNVGSNIGAWTKVRMTWVNFGYHFFSHFTLCHSTNGHSMNFVFYKSDLSGVFSSEAYRVNGISSWPGYTFTSHVNVSGWWDTRDVRMVFELNGNNGPSGYPNNAISIGHIGIMGGYSSFNRVFDWDGNRNITLFGNLTLPGNVSATGTVSGSSFSGAGTNLTGTANSLNVGGYSARWATGRTIALTGDVTGTSGAFDGTANLSFAATLANSGVTAGTYRSVTVDAKGRVTAGTNPTTLSGYGITDALPIGGGTVTGNLAVNGTLTATGIAYANGGLQATTGLFTGPLIVNNDNGVRASYDNGGSFAWLYGYGVEFGRVTSYVRPNTNRSATLFVGGPAINNNDWLNIDFYSSGRFTINNNAILHAGTTSAPSLSIGGNAATSTKSNSIVYPFLNTSLNLNTSGGSNEFTAFNAYYPSGGAYNQPIAGAQHFRILQFGRYDSADSNFWRGQMAMSFYEDRMWFRRENALTWQSWREFVHSGNVGSYALPLTGGTVTGNSGVLLASTNDARFDIRTGTAGAWLDIRSETLGYAAVNLYGSTVATGRWSAGMTGGNSNYRITSGAQGAGTVFMEMNSSTNATNFPNALQQNGNQVVHSGNVASYALPIGGGTVTGQVLIGSYMSLNSSASIMGMVGFNRNAATGAIFNASYGAYQLHNNTGTLELQVYNSAGGFVGAHTFNNSGNVAFLTGTVTAGGNQVVHAGNVSTYALPIGGGTLNGNLTMGSGYQHRASDGSASAPGYSFSAETSTGIYRSGTNTLAFSTGGSQRVTINGVGAMNVTGAITQAGNQVLHAGNYNSYAVDNTKRVKQFFWDSIGASATQARRFEIARIAIDIVNWNQVGTFEIELHEQYYGKGIKKRYAVRYGYSGTRPGLTLVEMTGAGDNNFQVVLGSEQLVSGNHYYLPIYVDVRYYSLVGVRVTTSRQITTNSTPPVGYTYINSSPTPTNITDFTADSTVDISNAATAWQAGGNVILHAGNFSSYRGNQLVSPNGGTLVAADSAIPDAANSFIHTLGLGPSGNDGHILGMTWTGTSAYGAQIWLDTDPNNRMAFRSRSSTGVWTGWNEVIHSSNYSSYALPLTGGTLTGALNSSAKFETTGNITGATFYGAGTGLTGTASSLTAGAVAWTGVTGKPTTLSGYGITDIGYGSTTSRNVWQISDWNQSTYGNAHFLSSESNATNGPTTDFIYGLQTSFHRSGAAYRTQMVSELYSSPVSIWVRNSRDTDVWTTWSKLLHSNNYNSYAPTLTGGGASGTWGINISGSAAQLNGQAASYYENRDTTAVGFSGGTLTLTRAAGNLSVSLDGRYLTGNQTISLSGDLSGSGATSISATIAANAVTTTKINNSAVTYAKIQNVGASSVLGNTSASVSQAPQEITFSNLGAYINGVARAWVTFNENPSTGAITINASLGISSVTRLAAGVYQVNFSTAFSDTHYAVSGTIGYESISAYTNGGYLALTRTATPKATTSCEVCALYGGTNYNARYVHVVFHR